MAEPRSRQRQHRPFKPAARPPHPGILSTLQHLRPSRVHARLDVHFLPSAARERANGTSGTCNGNRTGRWTLGGPSGIRSCLGKDTDRAQSAWNVHHWNLHVTPHRLAYPRHFSQQPCDLTPRVPIDRNGLTSLEHATGLVPRPNRRGNSPRAFIPKESISGIRRSDGRQTHLCSGGEHSRRIAAKRDELHRRSTSSFLRECRNVLNRCHQRPSR
ncbi:hypothetical protein SCOR_31465 [Sulfidibacter corallicola]